jgi:23S rRNA pseudouridine1911/1915/1917 synthase
VSDSAPTPTVIILSDEDDGERIDRVLARRCPEYSRSALQRWIEQGRVEQAGEVVSRKTKAEAGAEVTIDPAPPEAMSAEPQEIPLNVLFEDEHLLVLDKPAGLVVHPAPGHPSGTLVNALLHHVAVQGGSDPLRPGIVHRLDKDTSGVMAVAKTAGAHERLVEMFQKHALERAYLAIALGRPPAAVTYDTFHGRHSANRKKFTSRGDRGRRAVTHLEALELLHGSALVRCRLETGRTHQIREVDRRSRASARFNRARSASAACGGAGLRAPDHRRASTLRNGAPGGFSACAERVAPGLGRRLFLVRCALRIPGQHPLAGRLVIPFHDGVAGLEEDRIDEYRPAAVQEVEALADDRPIVTFRGLLGRPSDLAIGAIKRGARNTRDQVPYEFTREGERGTVAAGRRVHPKDAAERANRNVALVARVEAAIHAVLIDSDPVDAEVESVGAASSLRRGPEVALGARLEALAVEADEEADAKAVVRSVPKTRTGRGARAAFTTGARNAFGSAGARAARRAAVLIPAPSQKEKKAASQRQPPGGSAHHREPRLTRSGIRRVPSSERVDR